MLTSEQMKKLLAAGVTGEQLALFAEIVEEYQLKIESTKEKARDKKRAQRELSRDKVGTVPGHGGDMAGTIADKEKESPPKENTPKEKSPHTPLKEITPKEITPKEKETPKTRARVSIDELSVNHISDWLAKKRLEGKYLQHDEVFILEYFKNYCRSKANKYTDYVAALRNAFEWGACQPKGGGNGGGGDFRWETKFDSFAKGAARAASEGLWGSVPDELSSGAYPGFAGENPGSTACFVAHAALPAT